MLSSATYCSSKATYHYCHGEMYQTISSQIWPELSHDDNTQTQPCLFFINVILVNSKIFFFAFDQISPLMESIHVIHFPPACFITSTLSSERCASLTHQQYKEISQCFIQMPFPVHFDKKKPGTWNQNDEIMDSSHDPCPSPVSRLPSQTTSTARDGFLGKADLV